MDEELEEISPGRHLHFAAQMFALSLASAMCGVDEVLHAVREKIKSDDLGLIDVALYHFCQWATPVWFDEMDRNRVEEINPPQIWPENDIDVA